MERNICLETANGPIDMQNEVRAWVGGLGRDVACAETPCDVQALCIGKLRAEEGFSLTWRPFDPVPDLHDPVWQAIRVDVENFVPVLVGSNVCEKLTALPAGGRSGGDSDIRPELDDFEGISSVEDKIEPDSWERVVGEWHPMDHEAIDDLGEVPPTIMEKYDDDVDAVVLRINRAGEFDMACVESVRSASRGNPQSLPRGAGRSPE